MTPDPTSQDFRDKLFNAQQMTPGLRDAYRKELDAIVHETHTPRSRIAPIIFLFICLAVVAGEIRALLVYPGTATFYTGALTMLLACAAAAVWIVRDLYRGKSVRKESFKMADLFYLAASILTVASLMHGLFKPDEPASTFNAFFVYIFLVVCTNWAFSNRITSAELTLREHILRLETRLADLAERLPTK